jgi:hypothetical protein
LDGVQAGLIISRVISGSKANAKSSKAVTQQLLNSRRLEQYLDARTTAFADAVEGFESFMNGRVDTERDGVQISSSKSVSVLKQNAGDFL